MSAQDIAGDVQRANVVAMQRLHISPPAHRLPRRLTALGLAPLKFTLLGLALLGSCNSQSSEYPTTWQLAEIHARAISIEGHGFTDQRMPNFETSSASVLAWQARTRSDLADLCVVVIDGTTDHGQRHWILGALRRRPDEHWRIPWEAHTERHGSYHRTTAPSAGDVLEFIEQIPWGRGSFFDPTQRVRICRTAWQATTGEAAPEQIVP